MDDLLEQARPFPAATLLEASARKGALPSGIKPVWPGARIVGRALTVQSPPCDNLWLHRAIYAARPGEVLVVHTGDYYEAGYWGEIMACAAQQRGIAGLVIDACVRDRDMLEDFGFPVFARGLCIRGTGKDIQARGSIAAPVTIGGVTVHTGDLVVADADGVMVLQADEVAETLTRAQAREDKEAGILEQLRQGASTLDLYNFPPGDITRDPR